MSVPCAATVTFRYWFLAALRDELVLAGIFRFYLRTCAPISLAATSFSFPSWYLSR